MTAPTNKLDGAMMTDQVQFNEWLTELAEPFWLKDSMKQGEFFDVNGFARALLSASKPAAQELSNEQFTSAYHKAIGFEAAHAPAWLHVFADALLAASPAAPAQSGEPDDLAVDRFAAAMKEKMAAARAKGRGGWEKCSPEYLTFLLREHVEKGDPRDVANFCMMLWHHESRIFPLAAPQPSQPVEAGESFVKAVKSLAFMCRTETTRLDSETLAALDAVENHLVAMRASSRDADGELVNVTAPSAVVLDDEREAFELFSQIDDTWGPLSNEEIISHFANTTGHSVRLVRAASPQATEDTPAKLARDAVRMLEGYAESYESMAKMDSKSGDGTVQCRSVARDIRANMAGWFGPHLTEQATAPQPARTERALTAAEIGEFESTVTEFEDCGETSTDYAKLIGWTHRGLLECTNFRITSAGRALLTAAQPASGGAQ
jgi:hypothetical protein